jgi:DNA-binding NarL/FixJ family response regulator
MSTQTKVTVLIADDHPVFRLGLRQVIEADSAFAVTGEASDGEMAMQMIESFAPAIAILDIGMPKLDGLELARRLQEIASEVKIVFVTMYREERLFRKALEAGVKGYVLKDSAAIDIISCLNAVAAGQNYTSPELTTYLINRVRGDESETHPRSVIDSLTDSERRVLSLIADCKTSKEIAQELFISSRTVETHRNNICKKLDVHGSYALMKVALENKHLLPNRNSAGNS